jgi:hypothetical protein
MEFKALGTILAETKKLSEAANAPARYYQRPGSGLPYDTTSTRMSGLGGFSG